MACYGRLCSFRIRDASKIPEIGASLHKMPAMLALTQRITLLHAKYTQSQFPVPASKEPEWLASWLHKADFVSCRGV